MFESYLGSTRRIGDNLMTTGHDSLVAQLAANLIGTTTGDPFMDAIRNAAMVGAVRLGEMS